MSKPRKMLERDESDHTPHMKEIQADLFGGPQSAIDLEKFTQRDRGLQAAMAMHEIPVYLPMP